MREGIATLRGAAFARTLVRLRGVCRCCCCVGRNGLPRRVSALKALQSIGEKKSELSPNKRSSNLNDASKPCFLFSITSCFPYEVCVCVCFCFCGDDSASPIIPSAVNFDLGVPFASSFSPLEPRATFRSKSDGILVGGRSVVDCLGVGARFSVSLDRVLQLDGVEAPPSSGLGFAASALPCSCGLGPAACLVSPLSSSLSNANDSRFWKRFVPTDAFSLVLALALALALPWNPVGPFLRPWNANGAFGAARNGRGGSLKAKAEPSAPGSASRRSLNGSCSTSSSGMDARPRRAHRHCLCRLPAVRLCGVHRARTLLVSWADAARCSSADGDRERSIVAMPSI